MRIRVRDLKAWRWLLGVGFWTLWPQLLGLLIIGLATLTLAVKRFHKTQA